MPVECLCLEGWIAAATQPQDSSYPASLGLSYQFNQGWPGRWVTRVTEFQNVARFNIADSQSLAAVVNKCIELGVQNLYYSKYEVPHLQRTSGQLLDSAHEDIAASVQPIMDRAKKYGGTIASDPWSNVQKQPTLCIQTAALARCVLEP